MDRTVGPSEQEKGLLYRARRAVRDELLQLPVTLRVHMSVDPLVTRLVTLFVFTQLSCIFWDLPSSFSWDNDGVAPRDFFGGLAFNLTPGEVHRYPLLHYLILAFLSFPVLLVAAVIGVLGETSVRDVVLDPLTMSSVTVIARLLSVGMSACTVFVVAHITRRLFGNWSARYAAVALVCCVSFAWYGRATNLDGPYIFWVVLAVSALLDIGDRGQKKDWTRFAVFVACAVATKDQAYAPFALMAPLYLFVGVYSHLQPEKRMAFWRQFARAFLVGLVSYGMLSGAFINPLGFIRRLHVLTGTNSEDWRLYSKTLAGLWLNIADIWILQEKHLWSWGVLLVGWLGVGSCAFHSERYRRLLPFSGAVSSILCFTLVVGRSEERFLLTYAVLLTPYIGHAFAVIVQRAPANLRAKPLLVLLTLALCAHSGMRVIALGLTQWGDSRVRVEQFLKQLPQDTTVETYGLTVYQIRYPSNSESYRLVRVDRSDPQRRNPLPGVIELKASYMGVQERNPDVIIVPMAFANRYVTDPAHEARLQAKVYSSDADARTFFRAAINGVLPGYKRSKLIDVDFPQWARYLGMEPRRIQNSTGIRNMLLLNDNFNPRRAEFEAL